MVQYQTLTKALAMAESEDKSLVLQMAFGDTVIQPGQYLSRKDAQHAPTISLPSAKGEFVVVALDPDAPFISYPFLGPILHWMQTGLKPGSKKDGSEVLETSGTPARCNFLPPGPPPGAAPHRYIFMLFQQPSGDLDDLFPSPDNFKGTWGRIRFNLDDLEKQAKLGPVLAANYFMSN